MYHMQLIWKLSFLEIMLCTRKLALDASLVLDMILPNTSIVFLDAAKYVYIEYVDGMAKLIAR